MTDKTSENFALDCNGNKIFVGDKVRRMMNPSEFALDTYEVSEVVAGNIMLKNNYNIWLSNYFEVQKEYGKEYRLAILAPDSPIIIACNHKEFQEEFEESPGFVKWLTKWTEW